MQLSQNCAHYLSTAAKPFQRELRWKKWGTTAPNNNANRKYNRSWSGQQQHCKQKVEVNGHDDQLAALQRGTETIPELLEDGTYKPRRLLDQSPFSHTPPHSTANILNTKKVPIPTPTKIPSNDRGKSIKHQKILDT